MPDVRSLLATLGLRPSRALGQNFLQDPNLARWIVRQLDLQSDDHLVEIGPGLGALTDVALPLCKRATLIERDHRLAARLRARPEVAAKAEVVEADAARFDERALFPLRPAKILGNLPYSGSTAILLRFARTPSPADRMVFTVQKEVAQRLVARPGEPDYGSLTLAVGRRWQADLLRTLPPQVFYPVPQVESATVALVPRDPASLLPCDEALLDRLVRAGFSQRRKQLRKLLGPLAPDWAGAARAARCREDARAEQLALDQWVELARFLRPPGHRAQDVHGETFDIVDELDRPVGIASRHDTHARGLRHRAVHIFVFNRAGELFLQRRSSAKDTCPLLWDSSASGHVDAGSTYAAAAERELEEELGVRSTPVPLAALPASPRTHNEFVRLFAARHDGPFRWSPAEIDSGSFFPTDLVARWIEARPGDFAPGFLACFEQWRAGNLSCPDRAR